MTVHPLPTSNPSAGVLPAALDPTLESGTSGPAGDEDLDAIDPVTGLGRVVVLTGASSGIGHATAMAFAREGARLVLAARNREALEAVAEACLAAGGRALVVPTDVTDAAQVRALAEAAVSRFGHIDVWINNVGVGAVGLFDATPIDAHRRVIETNLIGHMNGAHAVLPQFRRQGFGTLINMISVGGYIAAPYAAAYSASKFGIRGLSEALRAEVSKLRNVHVCEVYPTFVSTPGMAHGANYTGRNVRIPPGTLDPRRVAQAIVGLSKRPRPHLYLGAPALPGIAAHAVAPSLVGRALLWITELSLKRADPTPRTDGNLYEASRGNGIDSGDRPRGLPSPPAVLLGAVLGAIAIATLRGSAGGRRAGRAGRPSRLR